MNINDNVFGDLEFEDSWIRKYQQTIFSEKMDIYLRVEGNDSKERIRDEQRNSFKNYELNNEQIIKTVENAVTAYYLDFCQSIGKPINAKQEISKVVELTGIIFPMVLKSGEQTFGLFFEADCDPENGIGVKFTNGEIEEVSTQDILT
ncbi:hypothetical protein TDB9533_04755 [Thalassocella blandensis]|nr:hypothetical protein TDB9533_04755 [Thalassocella blandensis]